MPDSQPTLSLEDFQALSDLEKLEHLNDMARSREANHKLRGIFKSRPAEAFAMLRAIKSKTSPS